MAHLGSWPTDLMPNSMRLVLQTNQRMSAAPGGGSEQVLDMLNDRWVMSLQLPPRRRLKAAALEAFLARFRGQVNTVDCWHFERPEPRGTLRGSPVTVGTQAQGAAELVITAASGATLQAGDMLGAGGLLLMVAAPCAESGGAITVPLVNRLRVAIAGGAAVSWNKPSAPFRVLSHSGVEIIPGQAIEVQIELGEVIT